MKGICSGAEAGTGKENVSSGQNVAGKKGFCLRDEDLIEECSEQPKKNQNCRWER